jgi:Lon protease-like protein
MIHRLPLFPLGTVLYPGLLLPLHIFEDRYRRLVRDLLDRPEPRRFGVIAIRKGRETGIDGISGLHEIGCTATLRRVTELEDGRLDLVAIGTQRFRLADIDDSMPYLQGAADLLDEETGDEAAASLAAGAVRAGFVAYLDLLAARGGTAISIPDLPAEPVLLSYLVAASVVVDLSVRQELLAAPDAAGRLAAERALLARETSLLRSLTSAPAPGLRYSSYNPN